MVDMHRPRSTNQWRPQAAYDSPKQFLEEGPSSGLNTVHVNGSLLDFFVEERDSPVTLLVFHAKVSEREAVLPVFSGRSLAADTNCNLISVSDPTLAVGDLDLAWFLGDKFVGRYSDVAIPIIRKCIEWLNTSKLLVFGSSGGAFAAVNIGRAFEGATVLAANPRLNLVARPKSVFQQYLAVAHSVKGKKEAFAASDAISPVILKNSFPEGIPNTLCIFQNSRDYAYYHHQVRPFVREHLSDPNLYLRTQDIGAGHRVIPSAMLRKMINELKISPENAGFKSTSEDFRT